MPAILFIDDDPNFLEAISEYFEDLSDQMTKGEKTQVFSAQGGRKAVPILKANRIDVTVTDIKLLDMDGIQFLGVLSKHFPQMTKIVLTTLPADEHRENCISAGAMVYLEKPKTRDEVQDRYQSIRAILNSSANSFRPARTNEELRAMVYKYCAKGIKNTLFVKSPMGTGRIYVNDGQIIHAAYGKAVGVNALREMLGLPKGEVKHDEYENPKVTSVVPGVWEVFFKDMEPREPRIDTSATSPAGDASQFTGKFLVPNPSGIPARNALGPNKSSGSGSPIRESPLIGLNSSPLLDTSAMNSTGRPPLRSAGAPPIQNKTPLGVGPNMGPPTPKPSAPAGSATPNPAAVGSRSGAFTPPVKPLRTGSGSGIVSSTMAGFQAPPTPPTPQPAQPPSTGQSGTPSAGPSSGSSRPESPISRLGLTGVTGASISAPNPAPAASTPPAPPIPVARAVAPSTPPPPTRTTLPPAAAPRFPNSIPGLTPSLSNPSFRPGVLSSKSLTPVTSAPASAPAPTPAATPASTASSPDSGSLEEFVVCTEKLRILNVKNAGDPEKHLDLIQFVAITLELLRRELRFDTLRQVEIEGDGFNAALCFRGEVRGIAVSRTAQTTPLELASAFASVVDASRIRPVDQPVAG